MIEIELKSFEEFERLNLPGVGTIFAQLEKRYPKIVEDTITDIKERCDVENIRYNSIFDIVTWAELIEYVDENIPEEILINYYVQTSCGANHNSRYFLAANGYQFKDADQ